MGHEQHAGTCMNAYCENQGARLSVTSCSPCVQAAALAPIAKALGLSLPELNEWLTEQATPVTARLDLRGQCLPITTVPVVVQFLERERAATACVGSNQFSPSAFFQMLDAEGPAAWAMFNMDRLSLMWAANDMEVGHMAAAAYHQGKQVDFLQALAALQTKHHERMAELHELFKQGHEHKETCAQHQQRMGELGELQRHCQQHLGELRPDVDNLRGAYQHSNQYKRKEGHQCQGYKLPFRHR